MICRTVAEALAAGLKDGAAHPPLTPEQVARLAAIIAVARMTAAKADAA